MGTGVDVGLNVGQNTGCRSSATFLLKGGRGFNIEPMTATSNFDTDFAELQSYSADFARYQFKRIISGTTVDTATLLTILDTANSYGVKVILAMPSNQYLTGIYFTEAEITSMWNQVMTAVSGHTAIWAYEPLNEAYAGWTAEGNDWATFGPTLVDLIRSYDPACNIIYSEASLGIMTKIDYDNILYSYHHYHPKEYTHENIAPYGALPPGDDYPGMTAWDAIAEMDRVWDAAGMRDYMQGIRDFQLLHDVPIFIGEFSVTSDATDEGILWIQDSIDLFVEWGWSWCWHSYYGSSTQTWRKWEPTGTRLAYITSFM